MSYREPVELVFDGAPIWMLSGDNGAGKSAIFDAITFALYGVHRNGKLQADALINHHSEHLRVELDLLLGENCYRVRRTLTRNSRGSYQVLHLYGPNHSGGRDQPVPETDSKSGLDRWVEQQIGMDEKGFLMSVLLQQGRTEALLSSKPAERHALLAQLVDLSRYEQLYERAEEHRKNAELHAQQYAEGLAQERQKHPPADKQTIADRAATKQQAEDAVKQTSAQLEKLIELKAHAEHWRTLIADRRTLDSDLQRMHSLIQDADTIQRDAARQTELQTVLPGLRRIVEERRQFAEARDQAGQHQQKAQLLLAQLQDSQARQNQADTQLTELQNQQQEAQRQKSQAMEHLLDLAPHMQHIKQLEELRDKLRKLEARLGESPADLDARYQRVERDLEAAETAREALPYLQTLDRARRTWRAALESATAATAERQDLLKQQQTLTQQLEADHQSLTRLTQKTSILSDQQVLARDRHKHALQHLERFQSVADAPTCTYCGQPLTEAHLAQERQRLEQELAARRREMEEAGQQHAQTQQDQVQAQQHYNNRTNQQGQMGQRIHQLDEQLRLADRQRQDAETEARRVLDELPRNVVERQPLASAVGIAAVLEAEYPTAAQLDELKRQTERIASLKTDQKMLTEQLHSRRHIQHEQTEQRRLLRATEQSYPPERILEIETRHQHATQQQQQAHQMRSNLERPIAEAQDKLDGLTQDVLAIQNDLSTATRDEREARARAETLRSSLATTIGALPEGWRAEAASCSAEQIATWTKELQALAGADSRAQALALARVTYHDREQQLHTLDERLQAIPEAARQSPAELDQQVQAARHEQHIAQQQVQQADKAHQELVERHKRIQDLAADLATAERESSLWKKLARLLGRDQLQRHLLHQAEASIVAHANHMLDRCSAGTLRLELQAGEEGAAQRAFDLIAYNNATGNQPLAAWLLSGSQRFRVAVSLALGIGQYASQENRPLETVIIDEGFGSLDRQGRQDMIEALRDLSGTLNRIILVSHQDEFARAFPNRYRIWLQGGASQARPDDDEAQ